MSGRFGRYMRGTRFTAVLILICANFVLAQNYSGTVTSRETGKPVEGVFVSVGHSEFYTRTDENGKFSIDGVPLSAGFTRPSPSKAVSVSARWNFRRRTLDLSSAPGVTSAAVYSLNGKRLVNCKAAGPSKIIELPGLPMGVYLLELRGDGAERLTGRVVLSNKNSSFTLRSNLSAGGLPRALSDRKAAASGGHRLIFHHDDYLPLELETSGFESNMSVSISEDQRRVVFDQTKVHEYRFTISPDDTLKLYNEGYLENYVKAAMEYNGSALGDVGIRYKGSGYTLPRCFTYNSNTGTATGPRTCDKISFKVKLTEYDKDKRLHGMKKINLHAMTNDNTKMHDMLSYALYRETGIHAPRTAYARVYINNVYTGLFAAVEEIDGRFTKARWPEHGDGNLYKEAWPSSGNEWHYLEHLKTNNDPEDNPNVNRMVNFYNAIAASTESNFVNNLSSYMDFDHFLRYMAVDVAINNWDGVRTFYSNASGSDVYNHNFFFYEEEEKAGGKIWLVPWDMDQTLQASNPYQGYVPEWTSIAQSCAVVEKYNVWDNSYTYLLPSSCDKLTGMMAKLFKERYKKFGEQFLNDQFQTSRLIEKIERYRQLIASHVAEDRNIVNHWSDWGSEVTRMKSDLSEHAAKFATHLNSLELNGGAK